MCNKALDDEARVVTQLAKGSAKQIHFFFSATVFFVVLQGLGVISKPLQPICTTGYSKTLLMIPM